MAQLDFTRAYDEGEILLESDLDTFLDEIEEFLNVILLNDDNFQTNGIDGESKFIDSTVTTAVIGTNAITSSKINDGAVTTAKILDANVTTAKIADSAVTTAKILDANVTTAKIPDSAVTTAKIAASNVTVAKKAAVNYNVYENDSYSVTVPYGNSAQIGNPVAITSVGRPTLISLSSASGLNMTRTSEVYPPAGVHATIYIKRNGTTIGKYFMAYSAVFYGSSYPAKMPLNYIQAIDPTPTVGTCSYTVELHTGGGGTGSISMTGLNIKVVEL